MEPMIHSQEITALMATFASLSPAEADTTAEHLRGILESLPETPGGALRSQLEAFIVGYDAGRQASQR